ncbi:MAG: pilus assembly protein TadG-related protein [Acidimicrobiales bacterium]
MSFTSSDEAGSVSAFVAVVAIGLVMVAGMAYDGGQVVAAQATARDLAASAARAGAQEVDLNSLRSSGEPMLDPDRAVSAAQAFLVQAGFTGTMRVNGSSITVSVTVHQPMRILPLADRAVTATDTATALSQEAVPRT